MALSNSAVFRHSPDGGLPSHHGPPAHRPCEQIAPEQCDQALAVNFTGIRANAICASSVAGPRIDHVFASKAATRGVDPPVVHDGALTKVSLQRLVSVDDIAGAILFAPADANNSGHALAVAADTRALA